MDNLIQSAPFMPPIRTIVVFGDLTCNFQRDLQQLLHIKDNHNLVAFFTRVSRAFRNECASLSQQEQEWIPRFTDLVDLLDNIERSKGASAVRFALLSVYQIGRFISHFGKPESTYPDLDHACLLGLCTGTFAAAAVSTSRTINELIPAGVEAATYALRTGLYSFRLQQDIEKSSSAVTRSWSAVISLKEQHASDLIERFVTDNSVPNRHRPYISAVSPTNVTISGPPSTLAKFLNSTTPKAHFLPIETPYHATHLFGFEDLTEIFSVPLDNALEDYRLRTPILSPSSQAVTREGSFETLLRQAVKDTLCEQVRWDKIPPTCASLLAKDNDRQECTILPCAFNAATLLLSNLSPAQSKAVLISNALNASVEKAETEIPTGRFGDSKIAVVGFSGRFPDAASNDELWELLMSGKDTHRTIPSDRFDWEAHFDPSGLRKNTSRVKYGCFVNEPGMFDGRFFNMSPREAEDTDPAQRLALMTTYEALEMAGFVPDRTPSSQRDRVGVFYGTTSDDWREINSGQNVRTYFIPGGNRAFVPGRITFFFRFSGPSISVDTACSSSFAALHTACQSLWQGGCDTAIAGGTNILTNPDNFAGLDRGHFLSTTGNCNPFDDDASGYCRADAVGSVVLKRLEDAEADNDPIFGVIAGVNTNHCGQTVSITRPHEGDQLSLFKRILRQSNTDPVDVSYVEMHGTGTQAGDAAEMSSVLAAMVPGRERMPRHPLYLGAIKANVGHSESASGVSALIKVLMMMRHSKIPPHVGIKNRINRNYPLDLAERNVNIALKPTPWRKSECPGGKRVSFLNNFSAAGGNTAVLLEDGPERTFPTPSIDPRTVHPVVISANSAISLKSNMTALLGYLRESSDTSLPALSYTTTARRTHHKLRVSFVGSEIDSIQRALEERLRSNQDVSAVTPSKKASRVAFAFTGQGMLYAGLAKQLFETVQSFRQDVRRFDRIARQHGFPSFTPLITAKPDEVKIEELDTPMAHLALVCIQMALYRLWGSWGVVPNMAIGHSLGEYPALYAAGVLSASDTIYLVGTRASLLSVHCVKGSHSMLAVKAPLGIIQSDVEAFSCDVACVNSPTDTVVSGPAQAIEGIAQSLREKRLECRLLDIPYSFHSAQVETWVDKFETVASRIHYHTPTMPFMSPLLERTISAGESGVLNGSYLARACRATVNFVGAIETAQRSQTFDEETIWLEIGSHPACSTFIKRIIGPKAITMPSLRQATDPWDTMVSAVQALYLCGLDIKWNEYHRGFTTAGRVLPLPSYKWDLKNHWIMYQGNFCLTKGDEVTPAPKAVEAPPAPYLSSSVHRILEEQHTKAKSTILVESDIHDPRLYPILQGHKVNGAALCPSSLYADMALTVARYMLQSNGMPTDLGLDCAKMKVDRPVIANPKASSHLLRLSASAEWTRNEISIALYSVGADARKIADHAICTVKITQAPAALWGEDWKRLAHFVQGRITTLHRSVNNGVSHKLKRGLVYKLFGSLVDYADPYQGMQEVVLDTEGLEATAQVNFQVDDQGFAWNPCWIDSLGHIAGFIMNGSDSVHSKDHVFINHGWSAMRCAKAIEHGKTYQSYNKMQPENELGNMYVGDTYILESGTIVAIFEGVKFQRVPRSALDHLLPSKARISPAATQQRPTNLPPKPKPRAQSVQRKQKFVLESLPKQLSIVTQLKTIICEEVGVDMKELDPHTSFSEFGIDSLLSLTISSRLQEELNLNLSSSSFVDFPTLEEMINHVAPSEGSAPSTPESPPEYEYETGDETDATSIDGEPDILATIRSTITEEIGLPLEELTDSVDFSELGVDSLLSLTIIGRLRELGVDVPSDLFAENQTLQEVKQALSRSGTLPITQPKGSNVMSVATRDVVEDVTPTVLGKPAVASSVRLQGFSSSPKKILFLFPDGAGSATSYAPIPEISSDAVVYGLNCPWMKAPQDLDYSLPQYVSVFVTEIRRRQPVGPYYLGGWSAGGILAYEAAHQLQRDGQAIEKLILLDAPDPIGIQSPPQKMYDFLEAMDMFGLNGRSPPSWLRPHFTAFITMLDQYRPVPFLETKRPGTHMIYARDGFCKNPGDPCPDLRPDDPREMHWLIKNRTDFSGGGWRGLVGEQHFQVNVVDDANHYTLLASAASAQAISQLIAKFLGL